MADSVEIINVTVVCNNEVIPSGSVLLKGGLIESVAEHPVGGADKVIDGKGERWTLVPGFIDVHIHGAHGHDVMDGTHEALTGMARSLPAEGTTSFLATTMTQSSETITQALKNIKAYMNAEQTGRQAEILGIHLEGPFLSINKAGAQPHEHILPPSTEQFDRWQEESGGQIRLVTLAPEVPGGLNFIEHLTARGVIASIGHSEATFDQVEEAVDAGARHVTHLYNQMSGFHHRDPGVVGAALLNERVKVEMIVDHVHARPEAVQLAYHHTKAERTILITDAMRAKCLPEGTYDLGGQQVDVKGGEARLGDGTLAGSVLTLQKALKNMRQHTELPWEDLVRITSLNAAEQLGLDERKGKIEKGKDADLVLLDENLEVVTTVCNGEIAYQREES
ncbi:N-acetylglucosamine-6-phosphate deacetylase [Halobacillus halophilus]|uniref:N-acetylglucosamine-6-phosphate deacetylase n=1 Tax=Halobacillus halophilus (strain ATCC 35676 / DSM 2266 / JCM 20832 / KCTC 3685 / LMG 17431 / NBRC 102448 / NCIMB 2269) TaxID=866895 RepID=I0JIW8_HALH3|nr:N-acetylglucosamine-6-phosphate deacetylase [Halobacillus halophilus]ASF41441.1 N-acetylglucosamine-6-phosphate deacetylase [Halobacillus halophilus]CCG44086.1 N-acetylglucosamine-6-phosphate deacetylase [Halobacillus halophilus DSM 2266]